MSNRYERKKWRAYYKKNKAIIKKRCSSPEHRAKRKLYRARPEVKARRKIKRGNKNGRKKNK